MPMHAQRARLLAAWLLLYSLLPTVDALHERATLSDAEWQALGAEFDAAQCIEILMLAGLYHAVSFVVNALALEPEPFAARF